MYNRILLIGLIAWTLAQILKVIIFWIINKRFEFRRFFGDGGMPSCHTACVTSVATAVGFQCGWDSPVFAVATILAIIVMHDAMGVRQETGKQAKVINNMLLLLESMGPKELTPAQVLKEFVGHTGRQVTVGAILGIAAAVILEMLLP